MKIWFDPKLTIEQVRRESHKGMQVHIGVELTELGDDYIKGTMSVDERTKQPYGLLHGGASCVLAETLGSLASHYCINPREYRSVGIEINANHVRGVTGGIVTGVAKPLHLGRTTHIWEIRIHDAQEKLVCVSRLTLAILKKE